MSYTVQTSSFYKGTFLVLICILLTCGITYGQITQPKAADDTVSTIPDTLLFKIQQAQAAITEINAANKKGYNLIPIRAGLADVNNNIAPIKRDLNIPGKLIDTKNLLNYNLILKDAQSKLNEWKTELSKYSNDLQRYSSQVVQLSSDSVLTIKRRDTSQKKLYNQQLSDLRSKLQEAGKVTTANLDTISRLLANVSASYLTVTDLQSNLEQRLKESGKSALGKESPYIWAAPKETRSDNIGELITSSYQGQNKILKYFIDSTWDNRTLLILFCAVFFIWVYTNFKKAKKLAIRQRADEPQFDHLQRVPVLASLIVLFNLTPLFEPDSPSSYIELTQFVLLLVLTVHFWRRLSRKDFKLWLVLVAVYIIIVFTNAIVHEAILTRLWLMLLNIGSLYMGVVFYKKFRQARFAERLVRPVLILYLILNSLSVILNVFGRISLAKVCSTTAIVGLTQVIGLAVFIQILTDALELQIKVSSASGGIFSRINLSKTRTSFKKVLSVIAVILWLLVLMINLSIAGGVFALVHQILVKPRNFGSVTFTLSNVLFFAVIVYLSNMLQKHVGVLFGESNVTFTDQTEHKSSKLVLIRLIIIIIGVLLAIAASGVPIDKLTVVLGALSVGIGLGMQNIVNNFVSGIILIFEKPFRIGDYVELADKKGKVQDIGIRSSKLLTPQGSEVVIPNGDLLSGRLVNWTLSNDYLKTEITFKVNIDTDIAAVTKVIEDEVSKANEALKNTPPEILVNSIAVDNIELKVLVWINSIYTEANFKSELLKKLLLRFRETQVKVM